MTSVFAMFLVATLLNRTSKVCSSHFDVHAVCGSVVIRSSSKYTFLCDQV